MTEAVRLVIWDLDETFWKGTLTEGGITEYVRANHDIVIAMAKRGIISSICSKNDEETTLALLREKGILDYFVFPSISWEPKGQRLASLIETFQLRPATVLFIDDNPNNRAEAVAITPDLQVADENIIPEILSDARFHGKHDPELTRLTQYKLLEARKRDERTMVGSNDEFLRACDVRVYVEHDVLSHLDRAIELINRTNQLNFTKVRLSENIEVARTQLREAIRDHFRQCGLLRVIDKYGDYGFVGFYMIKSGVVDQLNGQLTQRLEHYCFSCRTLGMQVEHWFYERLQRPQIKIVGDVLTDLSIPKAVDWIRSIDSLSGQSANQPAIAPQVRVHGGCEANAIAHYLTSYSDKIVITGNFHAGKNFFRVNGSSLLLSACDRSKSEAEEEGRALGVSPKMLTNDYFVDPPQGALFVFGGQFDNAGSIRYRHKKHGRELYIDPHGLAGLNLINSSEEAIAEKLASRDWNKEAKEQIASSARYIRENYELITFCEDSLDEWMEQVFDRIPGGSKIVLIVDHNRVRLADGSVITATWQEGYPIKLRSIVEKYPYAAVVSFSDHVRSDDEIRTGGNHYDRMVYHRMAEAIVATARSLPPKAAT